MSYSCLKHVIKHCEKGYERSGKNLFWSITNSGEISDKLKARDLNATSLSTYDCLLFTLLYLINQLKINLLILLKEPSREKALLTLHVMTEMQFLLRKNLKNIMHGHVKMYVMP